MSIKREFQCAKDLMEESLVFVDGLLTVKEAVEIMREKKVDSLIIKKRSDEDAYGIVAIQDLVREVIIPEKPSEDVNVFEIMTKPLITVPASMDIRYVARLLLQVNLWSAPVEENGEYIGMISLSTIIMKNEML